MSCWKQAHKYIVSSSRRANQTVRALGWGNPLGSQHIPLCHSPATPAPASSQLVFEAIFRFMTSLGCLFSFFYLILFFLISQSSKHCFIYYYQHESCDLVQLVGCNTEVVPLPLPQVVSLWLTEIPESMSLEKNSEMIESNL